MRLIFIGNVLIALFSIARAQWEPEVRLTWNDETGSSTAFNNSRKIASGPNGIIHVVWGEEDYQNWTNRIYYKHSLDRGTTWAPEILLSDTSGRAFYPSIAAVGETVHVVWSDFRYGSQKAVLYRRSTDNGLSWLPIQCVHAGSWNCQEPAIAAGGSIVHVVWATDSAGREIYYNRSTDNGVTWGSPVQLTFNVYESRYPSIATSGDFVHVVWSDWRDRCFEVYYLRSRDGGATWDSVSVRISGDVTTISDHPAICASDSHVHVVWFDVRYIPFELYYRSSADNGTTWLPEMRITEDTLGSYNPTICADGPIVHIVWEGLYGTADICHKMSTDFGLTWQPETRLTCDQFQSAMPSATLVDSGIHVVWTDFRDNEYGEIYYKRNLTGNRTAVLESGGASLTLPPLSSTIVRAGVMLRLDGSAGLELINVMGNRIAVIMPDENSRYSLPPGVYFVRGYSEGNKKAGVKKLVIVR